MRREKGLFTFMNFANIWVLPLKANLLFSFTIGVLFDGLKNSWSELSFKVAKSSLFFERLDNYCFEIVHFQNI